MGKQYTKVSNEDRKKLVDLIYQQGYSIARASEACGIYYPTAKAINKVFKREQRVQVRQFRYRSKNNDLLQGVIRNKLPVEKLPPKMRLEEKKQLTCGIKLIIREK
jgi:transposase